MLFFFVVFFWEGGHLFLKKNKNKKETVKTGMRSSSALVFKCILTWNYRNSFQGSENPEGSQRRDIPQVHKLCYISATGVGNTEQRP